MWKDDVRCDCFIKEDFIKKSLPNFVVTPSVSNCFVSVMCYVGLVIKNVIKNIITSCEIQLRCYSVKITIDTEVVIKCITNVGGPSYNYGQNTWGKP